MLNPRSPRLAAAAALLVAGALSHDAAAQGRGGSGGTGSGVSSGVGDGLSTSQSRIAPSSVAPAPSLSASSAVGTPAPQVPQVAPLSPPPGSNFLSGGSANPTATDTGGGSAPSTSTAPGGGGTTSTTPAGVLSGVTPSTSGGTVQTFPGSGGSSRASASPSESRPSTPGGGGAGLQACMGFWDAQTHMTKGEWAAACRRTENRLQNLRSELQTPVQKAKPKAEQPARASRDRVSGAKSR